MRKDIEAIVVGLGSYNDLGLIRSCGECGIRSIYINHGNDLIFPINKSRYVSKYIKVDPSGIINTISDLCSNLPIRYIVFPASDKAVDILDQNFNCLPTNVITSHAYNKLSQFINKDLMSRIAAKSSLRIPQTYKLKINEEITLNFPFPIILKPINSNMGSKDDITICHSDMELIDARKNLKEKGYEYILVQQYLNNSSSKEIGITGVALTDGNVKIGGYIHKIRNRGNINNYGIFYPEIKEDIIEGIRDFIKETGYHGLFDTDFIEYNGQLYFIECNFRNGAYGYATTAAGFNMPYIWICDLIGAKPKRSKRIKKVIFMEERTDVLNVFDGAMSSIKWLKEMLLSDTLIWWNIHDPIPVLSHYLRKLHLWR